MNENEPRVGCRPLDGDYPTHRVQWHSGRKLAELTVPVRRLYSFQIVAQRGAA